MRLRHDILDAQLRDRNDAKMGRVDSVVLAQHDDQPLHVLRIEAAGGVLAWRTARWLGRLITRIDRRMWGDDAGPAQIPWEKVTRVDHEVHVDVDANSMRSELWEHFLREAIVKKIPRIRK